MNLRELTGERDSPLPSIWWYFLIATLLMLATFGAWLFWARLVRRAKGENLQALLKSQRLQNLRMSI